MRLLDQINDMMNEGSTTKKDTDRLIRIKKMLGLKESQSIKTVPTPRLKKFVETYGNIAKSGLKHYMNLTEDAKEKERISKVLSMLGL